MCIRDRGNIVVSYEKGGICLFTVNGKLLCDISHSESVQVLYYWNVVLLSVCLSITNSFFQWPTHSLAFYYSVLYDTLVIIIAIMFFIGFIIIIGIVVIIFVFSAVIVLSLPLS